MALVAQATGCAENVTKFHYSGGSKVGRENDTTQYEESRVIGFGSLSDNQLLNYTQAAQFLGVSPQYLRELKSRGRIAAVEIGPRCVRFRVASLNKFVLEREVS